MFRRKNAPVPPPFLVPGRVGIPVPPSAALQLDGVTKVFHSRGRAPVEAVRSASLTVPRGQLLAVVGESGSGKSTLMHCAAGLTAPTHGSVRILGTELTLLSAEERSRFRVQHVGFVFQELNLVSSLTVLQNVLLPARLGAASTTSDDARAILDVVGLGPRAQHLPHELSGGEQQRVAIARVMATRPAIVFADEPTSALDLSTSATIMRHFRQLVDRGTTVVMVTHDLDAATCADRAVLMADGTIVEELSHPTREALVTRVAERSPVLVVAAGGGGYEGGPAC